MQTPHIFFAPIKNNVILGGLVWLFRTPNGKFNHFSIYFSKPSLMSVFLTNIGLYLG